MAVNFKILYFTSKYTILFVNEIFINVLLNSYIALRRLQNYEELYKYILRRI